MTAPVISAGDLVERLRAFGGITPDHPSGGSFLNDAAVDLVHEAAARIQELEAAISTPEAVIANMKRGGIALPSLRYLIDLHGDEALAKWDQAETAENHLRDIIRAHDDNSGNEPSASVFERAIDLARSALNQDGGKI